MKIFKLLSRVSNPGRRGKQARRDGDVWRLAGDKWFCPHADADDALMLARPKGAPTGTKGLAPFALPRRLKDGSRNSYRIVRRSLFLRPNYLFFEPFSLFHLVGNCWNSHCRTAVSSLEMGFSLLNSLLAGETALSWFELHCGATHGLRKTAKRP
jgi:hypothetical protein